MAVVNLTPTLPHEVWQYLFSFFSNPQEIFKIRLVCRDWQALVFISWKDSHQEILDHFFKLTFQPGKMIGFAADLEKISQGFHSSIKDTPQQLETSFWQAQAQILTSLKKLSHEDHLAVCHLFGLEKMTLIEAIQTKSFETFSIVFATLTAS
jgi:F-box associated protein